MTITVFWPRPTQDLNEVEYTVYGWTQPAICVAALVHNPTNNCVFDETPSWQAVKNSCAGDPKPIEQEEFTYILYDAHIPKSLRFYTLHHPIPTPTPKEDYYAALARYDFTYQHAPKGPVLDDTVINQMNAVSFVQFLLHFSSKQREQKLLPATATFLLSFASPSDNLSRGLCNPLLTLYTLLKRLTNLHVWTYTEERPGGKVKVRVKVRLKDISAVAQHIDTRLSQARFFATQVSTLQRKDIGRVGVYAWRYTNFFNTAWLILNDITLGVAFGSYVVDNSELLAAVWNGIVREYIFTHLRNILAWLDAWPAGLKLNAELSAFYVRVLVGVLDWWEASLPPLSPSLIKIMGSLAAPFAASPSLLTLSSLPLLFLPFGGLTLLLSILSDLTTLLLTPHLRIAYELTRAVYRLVGVVGGAGLLGGVFRGKRSNALRQNRTDTFHYDLDQLLFGTVVFTLLAFLGPTVGVYYLVFGVIRLLTLLLQATLETLLALLNHFPLFSLMLRVKDPGRLAGSVYFLVHPPSTRLVKVKNKDSLEVVRVPVPAYLSLQSQPIPFSKIFVQYVHLSQILFTHYNPLRLLWLVLKGEHVRSIGRFERGVGGYVFGVDDVWRAEDEGKKGRETGKEKVE